MEEEIFQQIVDDYRKGLSIRKIAKKFDLKYGYVRYYLVKKNIYKPILKFCKNGKVSCKRCNKKYPEEQFIQYNTCGHRLCNSCLSNYQLEYNMFKLGATADIYNDFYEKQNGKCGICERKIGHITKDGREARLALDHCHKTNKIRGLLCGKCNRGLGFLEENIEKALIYLKKS
jgi:hypothetical protein